VERAPARERRPHTGVLAARSGSSGAEAFGPAETITDQPPGANASTPAIASMPGADRPVVAWEGGGGLLVTERTG
jgi:hypothetical protein